MACLFVDDELEAGSVLDDYITGNADEASENFVNGFAAP